MHDLESFFWVLFWICVHYEGPGKGITVERFEKWNYMSTEELAAAKQGVISEEVDFLRIAEDHFTPYYQSLIPCVNRLRRLVFPDGGRWKKPNVNLPRNMIETLQDAQYNADAVNYKPCIEEPIEEPAEEPNAAEFDGGRSDSEHSGTYQGPADENCDYNQSGTEQYDSDEALSERGYRIQVSAKHLTLA
ncbi:hypothetical protein AJ78_03685 [Emergomyces pasteurianus Ep9510]|uniref:Fungal-type protein kinase domain-containing protein n=1 Tax=Emergomyces pasteurianus Ep9510 TaxID=1447872 RepID=A0A1J9PI35_9EURO|nr:hypothetical protein AJ78_03685 [Emergomyces pasteurianus Ep9510]